MALTAFVLACATCVGTALPINPGLFGFSSYQGPIVNLTFTDTGVERVMDILRPGMLRYPGGSTSNSWNVTDGRWVSSASPTGGVGLYVNRTLAFPPGTFTPKAYMAGVGGQLPAAPVFNTNLVSMPDAPGVLDVMKGQGVAVQHLELGNEKADSNLTWYLTEACPPVVRRARALFPQADVSIIGCFSHPWQQCAPKLKAARGGSPGLTLFDAVSIHHYAPTNETVSRAGSDLLQRSATLAACYPGLRTIARQVSTDIAPDVSVWLDEFNWGGSWSGAVMWPSETRGSLRGLHWAASVLSAIALTEEAASAGHAGFGNLLYYSLLYQPSSPWSAWASVARVSNSANRPQDVAMDGVAQVIAHVNFVAFASNFSTTETLNVSSAKVPKSTLAPAGPCVLAVKFSGAASAWAVVVINVCPTALAPQWPTSLAPTSTLSSTVYNGHDTGGWVLADDIPNVMTPPWCQGGPISAHCSSPPGLPTSLPPVSLTVLQHSA